MDRCTITNNGPIDGQITITDLDTGEEIEGISGFFLEVDKPNGKVILTLRKTSGIAKYNLEFATPDRAYRDIR